MMHFSLIITMLKVIYPCALNHLYTLENMSQQTEDSNNTSDIDTILNIIRKEDYLSGVYNDDVLDEDIFLVGKDDYNVSVDNVESLMENTKLNAEDQQKVDNLKHELILDNIFTNEGDLVSELIFDNIITNEGDLVSELIFDNIFTNDGDLVSESKENKRKATAHDSLPQNNDTLPARKKTGIDASKKSIIANSDLKKDESVFEMIVVPKAKNGNGGGSHANGNGNGGGSHANGNGNGGGSHANGNGINYLDFFTIYNDIYFKPKDSELLIKVADKKGNAVPFLCFDNSELYVRLVTTKQITKDTEIILSTTELKNDPSLIGLVDFDVLKDNKPLGVHCKSLLRQKFEPEFKVKNYSKIFDMMKTSMYSALKAFSPPENENQINEERPKTRLQRQVNQIKTQKFITTALGYLVL